MKIAFTGAQSTGKTTLCNLVKSTYSQFSNIKHYQNSNDSYVKKNLIENLDKDMLQVLFLTFHEISMFQNQEEWCAERAPLDALAYSMYDYKAGKLAGETMQYVAHKAFSLTNQLDYVFWLRPEFEIEDNGIRNIDVNYQKEIDEIFVDILADKRLQVPVVRLSGNIEDRMKQLENYL